MQFGNGGAFAGVPYNLEALLEWNFSLHSKLVVAIETIRNERDINTPSSSGPAPLPPQKREKTILYEQK